MNRSDYPENSPDDSSAQTWQKFTFFNETCIQPSNAGEVNVSEDGLLLLSQTQKGDRVRIINLDSIININQLSQMGFLPGAELQVLSRTASGSVMVMIFGEMIGIGEAIANQIWVTASETRDA
ncbi:MAG: ferrous iron transport protein A [Stigonema ocellatum SAG 48.90 = DSM 106950]|nr:ferrous iron transport protein A [Stigonema ocellatum SAG 48.90 = DSM 106950]